MSDSSFLYLCFAADWCQDTITLYQDTTIITLCQDTIVLSLVHYIYIRFVGQQYRLIEDVWVIYCYCLDKRLNCLIVDATSPSFAVHMTRVLYMSHASVRGPVSGHQLSRSVLLGYLNLMSG
jgi:hypothetical protein